MNEPKGCPTPGACSALDQIAALMKERDKLLAHVESTAPTPRNPDEAACTARKVPGQDTPSA